MGNPVSDFHDSIRGAWDTLRGEDQAEAIEAGAAIQSSAAVEAEPGPRLGPGPRPT